MLQGGVPWSWGHAAAWDSWLEKSEGESGAEECTEQVRVREGLQLRQLFKVTQSRMGLALQEILF